MQSRDRDRDATFGGALRLSSVLLVVAASCGTSDGSPDGGIGPDAEPDAMDGAPADSGARDAGDASARDTAPPVDAADSSPPRDAPPSGMETLLMEPGCFFTPDATNRVRSFRVGDSSVYERIEVSFSVIAGPFQPPIPDPSNRTEHILFELSRANRPRSYERFLMGAAAVDFVSRPAHFRMFGREEIAMGFMSYTQVSGVYDAWTEGERYGVACSIDASTRLQRCDLSLADAVVATRELAVDYLDADTHMDTGFDVSLGTDQPLDHDHLQTPRGWEFCDLSVVGRAR